MIITNMFSLKEKRSSRLWISCLLWVAWSLNQSVAQTAPIPDSAFCNCLKETHPEVIDANRELIILKAIDVTSIDCQGRNIKSVEGLQYFIKASTIIMSNNQIDSIPDLDNYTLPFSANGLFIASFGGNRLKSLPKFPTTLPIILDLQENQLTALPSISVPANIRSLNLQRNTGMAVPDLSTMINLEQLYADYNEWGTVPDLSNNPKLIALGLANNKLYSLPNLSAFNLSFFRCESNNLTYEDLLSVNNPKLYTLGIANSNYWYTPQNPDNTFTTVSVALGGNHTIDLGFDAAVTGSSYVWSKSNSSFSATTTTNKLTVANFTTANAGFYTATVTNSTFPLLTLTSSPILLKPTGVTSFSVPDAAFRACLKDSFPTVFNNSEELIPAEATKINRMVCYKYPIADITGVEYFTNLGLLNISSSNLISLPTLPNKINSLILEDNKLQSVAGIEVLGNNLSYLRLGGNPNLARPNLSAFSSLAHFSCRENHWHTVPDFSAAPSIGNLDLSANDLDTLPNLSALTNLSGLEVLFNNLTFSDLLKPTNAKLFSSPGEYNPYYRYETQNKFGTYATTTLAQGASHTIQLGIDADVPTNVYKWFLNGDSIATTTVNSLTITNFNNSKEGIYTAVVSNPKLPLLKLYSNDIKVVATADQHVVIPDANFKQCLADSLPQVLDAEGKLIPNEAAQVDIVRCKNRGIVSLSGIEYFTSLFVLDCPNNKISFVPDLDGINAGHPERVLDIVLNSNELTALPKLPVGTAVLAVRVNKITSLSNLEQLPNLEILLIDNNPGIPVPNFSNFSIITHFDGRNNGWTSLPSFANNLNLRMVHVGGNPVNSLPDLSMLDSLENLNCAKSKLTFEDLLPIQNTKVVAADKIDTRFFYAPQDSIGSTQTISIVTGGSYVINLGIDASVTTNSYKWYKDGQPFTTTNAPSLEVNAIGKYTCQVTNPALSKLVLYSRATTIIGTPWTPVIAGDQNQIVIVPSNVSANINGFGLSNGDYIGAFFHSADNSTLVCGALTQWNGTNTTLTVYGSTSVSQKNGFDANEAFVIKVWKTAEQKEYLVNAQYRTDSAFAQGFYGNNRVAKISALNFATCVGQTINLYKGWNLISFNVTPDNTQMSALFAGISPVIVKNAAGNILYAPQNGISNGIWSIQEGYLVYVTQNQVLSVCGAVIDPNTSIAIPQRSYPYFLPYYAKNAIALTTALGSIKDQIQYVQSMEYNSTANGIVAYNYVPEQVITPAINEIGTMKPGLAYKIMVNTTIPSFRYNSGNNLRQIWTDESEDDDTLISKISQHFGLATIATGQNSVLVVPKDMIATTLVRGDELGIFATDGTLVGSAVYTGHHLAVTLWEHAAMTTGQTYTVKYWTKAKNTEKTLSLPVAITKSNDNFKVLGADVTGIGVDQSDATFLTVFAYPNPANDHINFSLPQNASNAEITISNILGENIATLVNVQTQEVKYNTEALPQGIYYYQVKFNNTSVTGTFVVSK